MNKDERKNKAVMGNLQQQQQDEDSDDEQFPAGINVLAVDDDETCLMWLDHLLHECQYKVTTTLHAREALEMLRQNKGKYDIVITDVQMPDMDGFQLLETIAIEMDIPVIMMSMYNDHEYVERGVLKGAVDYLLKPVRQEEIQNIWQHVLRRRQAKAKAKGKQVANQDGTGSQGGAANGVVVDSAVSAGETNNRKRRDLSDEDYEEENGSGRENDEQTSQKRPRVVWTPELHRKFVTAVNQLGMDKAVPKKILDMMDVEGLTRENIASHLQKYRMYLKRFNNGNQQQMMGVMAGRDSLEAMNYSNPKLPNSLLTGYPPSLSGILGAKQNPASVNFPSPSSTDLIQSGQNLRNSIASNARLQPNGTLFPNEGFFQGGFNPGLGATGFGVSSNTMDPKMVNFDGNGNSAMIKSGPFQFSQSRPSSGPGAFKFSGTNAGFFGHSAAPDSWKSAAQHPMNGTFPRNPPPMNNNGINPSAGIPHQQLVGNDGRQRWDQGFVFGAVKPFLKANGNGMVMDSGVSLPMDQTHLGANNVGDFIGQILNTNQTMNQHNVSNDGFIVPEHAPIESMEDIMNSMIGGREGGGGGAPSAMFDGDFSFEDYSPVAGL